MKLSIIVAMSENRVIGINNRLPWNLPEDLKWFKKNTLNKVILMGRKTWESLPLKPLPQRYHIILSRDADYTVRDQQQNILDIPVADHVEKARILARQWYESQSVSEQELMVIGGASIYQLLLNQADRLYLSVIEKDFSGDAYFPQLDENNWTDEFNQRHYDHNNQFHYRFIIKNRK